MNDNPPAAARRVLVLGGTGTIGRAAVAALVARGHLVVCLVRPPTTGRYDAAATPETGHDTLFDYYQRVVDGHATVDRGDHAVF